MSTSVIDLEPLVRLLKPFKSIHLCRYFLHILDGGYDFYVLSVSGEYRANYTFYQPQTASYTSPICLEITEDFIKRLSATKIADAKALGLIEFTDRGVQFPEDFVELPSYEPEKLLDLFGEDLSKSLGTGCSGSIEPKLILDVLLKCPVKPEQIILSQGILLSVTPDFSRSFCVLSEDAAIESDLGFGHVLGLSSTVLDKFDITNTCIYSNGLSFIGSTTLKGSIEPIEVSVESYCLASSVESGLMPFIRDSLAAEENELKTFTLEEFDSKLNKVKSLKEDSFDMTEVLPHMVSVFKGYKLPQLEFNSIKSWLTKVKKDSNDSVIFKRVDDVLVIFIGNYLYMSTLYKERDSG